jgi:hypothetical protein
MSSDLLSAVNTFAVDYVPRTVIDNIFKHDPLFAWLKKNVPATYPGGDYIREIFRYDAMNGGAFSVGEDFNITQPQTDTAMKFSPKLFYVNVTEDLALMNVQLNPQSAQVAMNKVEMDMRNAADTMAANLSIALYQNGTRAGYTKLLNGLAEIVNDGSTSSWDSSAYAAYGDITRAGTVSPALNGKVTAISGPITYNQLEKTFNEVVIGQDMPNLGVTTNLGMTYIRQRFQPQQKVEGMDADIGFKGMKFNGATIIQSQYCPGTAISATSDKIVTKFMTTHGLTYPAMTSETFFWLTTKSATGEPLFKLYVSSDRLFGFGFTGFKRAQGNVRVAGQYLAALNIVCRAPRLQHQLTGISA